MRRKDAFRKLRTICQRLDEAAPNTFFVVPRRLYLFGSVLTDKPDPADIDLNFVHDRSPHQEQQFVDYLLRLKVNDQAEPVAVALIEVKKNDLAASDLEQASNTHAAAAKPLLIPTTGGDSIHRYYQDAAIRAVLKKNRCRPKPRPTLLSHRRRQNPYRRASV